MKFYWGPNSIPELKGLPKVQQRQLWRTSVRASLHRPIVWGSYAFLLLTIMATSPLLRLINIPGGIFVHALVAGLVAGLVGLLVSQIIIRAIRPVIAARRAVMEPQAQDNDGSYHVPPAF